MYPSSLSMLLRESHERSYRKVGHKYNIRCLLRLDQATLNSENLKSSSCALTTVVLEFPVSFLASITGDLLELHILPLINFFPFVSLISRS